MTRIEENKKEENQRNENRDGGGLRCCLYIGMR